MTEAIAKAIIQHFEGLSLKEYICPAGFPTIGYGRRIAHGQYPQGITQEQADTFFAEDIQKFNTDIALLVKAPLTNTQRGALLSFVYNVGKSAFASSTLLKLLNRYDYGGAQLQFHRWIHDSDGKVLPGLVRRRKVEAFVFAGNSIKEVVKHNWFIQEK